MTPEQNKKTVVRFTEEYLNNGNFAVLEELTAKNYVNHLIPPGVPQGRQGEEILYGMFKSAFPDFRITISDVISEGNNVAAKFTFSGTHTGEYAGIPGTGKKVTQRGVNYFTLENGLILENEPGFDQMGVLQQIGAFPPKG